MIKIPYFGDHFLLVEMDDSMCNLVVSGRYLIGFFVSY